jgi:2-desacetyl-2-hydroxyethyl bacteriochlorophyllide A dehydrogenase
MATMQALTFYGPRDVRVEEVPRPEIQDPGDVLLRIDRAAICGTDLHPYHGRMEIEAGFVLGHEYLGTIEAKGDAVTEFEEGERAVGSFFVSCGKCWFCRRGLPMKCMGIMVFGLGFAFGDLSGAQSQYMRVPQADLTLRKIPEEDGLVDEDLLFVGDILTTGYDAVRKTDMRPGDVVAIVGCGPVGLCTAMAARALGAGKVVVVDMVPERLKLAEDLGAIAVNAKETDADDVVLELTNWRGADVVVDAVGSEQALAACFPLVRMGGTISLPGMYVEDSAPMPIGDMWLKNITIQAGVANIQGHMDEVIELIREGRLDPKVMISHRLPLSEAPKGYELFDAKEALKVVLDPTQ